MHKRSAMTIAAGLVLALMVGAAAVAMGATGPDPTGGSDQVAQQPHVRTITRTVEVRRGPDGAPALGAVAAPATQSPSSSSFDDARWDDHGDDDDDRWDDHGDDDDHGEDDDHGDDD